MCRNGFSFPLRVAHYFFFLCRGLTRTGSSDFSRKLPSSGSPAQTPAAWTEEASFLLFFSAFIPKNKLRYLVAKNVKMLQRRGTQGGRLAYYSANSARKYLPYVYILVFCCFLLNMHDDQLTVVVLCMMVYLLRPPLRNL